MWREANGYEKGEEPHPTIPGLTVQKSGTEPEEGAAIIGQ